MPQRPSDNVVPSYLQDLALNILAARVASQMGLKSVDRTRKRYEAEWRKRGAVEPSSLWVQVARAVASE